MKISIITAVFNRKNTIKDAVDSLHRQTYNNYEHIVVDGGSTDGTIEILESTSDSRTSLKSENDRGIYDAFNKGLDRCTGDIIGFLHSDDFYCTDVALEKVAAAFKETDCDFLYANLLYVSKDDPTRVVRNWISGQFKNEKLRYGWMPPHPTVFFKRKLLQNHGGFNEIYKIAADYDFILRYLLIPGIKVYYMNETIVKMRTGGASNASAKHLFKKSSEDYRIIEKSGCYFLIPQLTLAFKNLRKISQFFN